jgi:hypothetical protein
MSADNDKAAGPPRPDPDKQPLADQEVHVTAIPSDQGSEARRRAQDVKEKVKQRVREAVKKAAPGGVKKQLDAADDAVDEARDRISRRQATKIKVTVKGKDGHGDAVEKTREVTPKEK